MESREAITNLLFLNALLREYEQEVRLLGLETRLKRESLRQAVRDLYKCLKKDRKIGGAGRALLTTDGDRVRGRRRGRNKTGGRSGDQWH